MIGDGYTTVLRCETVDLFDLCVEPDACPVYCALSQGDSPSEVSFLVFDLTA